MAAKVSKYNSISYSNEVTVRSLRFPDRPAYYYRVLNRQQEQDAEGQG